MENYEAVERFDQAHGARIEKLFWIAGSLETYELKELLNDLEDDEILKLFPEIYNSEEFNDYRDDNQLIQSLTDFGKFGLIAKVLFPNCYNFSYDGENEPRSWSVNEGICRIEYAYSETLEDLLIQIEKLSNEVFNEYIVKDKKKRDK